MAPTIRSRDFPAADLGKYVYFDILGVGYHSY